MAVIFTYPYVVRIFYPQFGRPPIHEAVVDGAASAPKGSASAGSASKTDPFLSSASPSEESEEVIETYATGPYEMRISKTAGSIVSLRFLNYVNAVEQKPILFFDAQHGSRGTAAVDLMVGRAEPAKQHYETQFFQGGFEATMTDPGYVFSKKVKFADDFGNELSLSFTNQSQETKQIQFRVYAGSGLVARNSVDNQYFEANWIGEKEIVHIKPLGKDKTKRSDRPFPAAAIKSRHFSSIFKPDGESSFFAETRGYGDHIFSVYLISPVIDVPPGQTWNGRMLMYIGPNYELYLNPFGLDHVVNFGKLDVICKLLLGFMQETHKLISNYGVDIILLTLVLNLLLFPLTRASLMSMKRMQLVQPQINKLKEKFKNDQQRLTKETMELYKKHNVNPMGGCLPMILQMPVFISLYVALSKSFDLLNARFLWISDLTSPDSVYLPFSLPILGNKIHVLPLIMMVGMVVQQRITSSSMPTSDPQMAQQQKTMAVMMPIMFGFLFYQMPSGLVLYWLTNTVFMITVNLLMRSKAPVPAAEA